MTEKISLQKEVGKLHEQVADLERKLAKTEKVKETLMSRVENSMDSAGDAYSVFEKNILLHQHIEERKLVEEELRKANKKILEQQDNIIEEERLKVLLQISGAEVHELDGLLDKLLNSIDLIKADRDDPDKLVQHMLTIDEIGARISKAAKSLHNVHQYETEPHLPVGDLNQQTNILSVEDSDVSFAIIKALLKKRTQISLLRAKTIQEALTILAKNRSDLILLDYRLPDGTGMDFLSAVNEKGIKTPVVVVTGEGDEMTATKALQAGAYDYLPKNRINKKNLLEIINGTLKAFRLRNETERAQQKIAEMSTKDELTGLFNRRYFLDVLERDVAMAKRYKSELSLCMMDLDHFKTINDTYGHPAGDLVLSEIGRMLKDCTRDSDLACRYGGEEFTLVLPNSDIGKSKIVCERFRETVAGHQFEYESSTFNITVSIGIARYKSSLGQSSVELISAADQALYQAKGHGRNRVVEYGKSLEGESAEGETVSVGAETVNVQEHKSRILITEDNEATRKLLERKLTKWGHEVISTKDGMEALRLIATPDSPNLLILDWMMPGMDGVETCRKIRQLDGNIPKYVILLTALKDEKNVVCALEAGANDYVTKPFNYNELHARINVGLRNVESESALANKIEKFELEIANRQRAEMELQKSETLLQEIVSNQTYEIRITQRTSIESLATLAEYNDKDTGAHLKRLQGFVRLLAAYLRDNSPYSTYLKKRPSYIDELSLASLLHDIGKIAIPTHILTKPGRFTDEEFELMKNHTTVAGEMLEKANSLFRKEFGKDSYLALARDIAYYHHEKWNGQGYPGGLSGDSIPLSARIVALADVYDALTSKRSYKEAWPHEDAVKEIKKESGQHFDHNVVEAFVALSDKFKELSEKYHS